MTPVKMSRQSKITTAELVDTLTAVAEYGSIMGAARETYLSVPTVLNRLRTLEKRMGRKVVNSQRGLRATLTRYGHKLCDESRQRGVITFAEAKVIDSRAKYPTAVAMLESGASITEAAVAQKASYGAVARVWRYMQAADNQAVVMVN